jgi:hypothetical protein
MAHRRLSSLLTTLLLTSRVAVGSAQVEQGTITGRVFDQGGGVVPGASVTVTETAASA